MNRTTKTLLAAGGVIVLSYPGIAWVTGIAIERRIQGNEQQLLDQIPYLRLVSREYHRGVYRSTEIATYGWRNPALQTLKIAGGAPLFPGATITVQSTIEHGPLPGLRAPALAVIDSTVIAPPALQQQLASVLGSTPVLQAHTTIGFFGGARTELTGPPFSLRLADGSTLAWGGLTSTLQANRNAARWSGQLIAPRFALKGAQGGIELSGLEYSGSQEKAFDGLYLGPGTFTLEQLKGSSHAGEYSLQRVSISSTSKVDGEFFDMRVDAATDAATLPSLQLKNLAYSESFEHVHGPSFASMMQAIRGAERQVGAKPAQFQTDLQQAVRQYGVEVLLHDPVLNIRQLSFAMPEGSFHLSAKISAPGLARADLKWPAVIVALQKHAEVTADLRVDNDLLQKLLAMGGSNPKITAQLTSFEQQGYLSAAAGAVTTHLEYSGGRLTLNGHPFPPAPPAN